MLRDTLRVWHILQIIFIFSANGKLMLVFKLRCATDIVDLQLFHQINSKIWFSDVAAKIKLTMGFRLTPKVI